MRNTMKNNRTFLEKLLDGAEVEWKPLMVLAEIGTGNSNRQDEEENGKYPFYVHSKNILRSNSFQFDETAIIIPGEGGIGDIFHYVEGKYALHQRAYRIHITSDKVNTKFLYYIMHTSFKKYILSKSVGATAISIRKPMLEKFEIPIPPLSVQTEIVRILDTLTALTSELILRRKQYEYYREKLLSHNDSENSSQQKVDKDKLFSTSNIQWLHLNEIYKFQYGIGNKIPTIGGDYPVYGSNGIVGSHNEYNSEDAPVIGHIGAYAGIVNWAEGKHFVTYNGIICNKINDNVNSRYAYYLLLSQNFIDKANKASQPFISYDILNKCIVPVPPIGEQQRIVSILDKFEILTNSITEGLPLAIEQSQKRYEYYRELLLNFS